MDEGTAIPIIAALLVSLAIASAGWMGAWALAWKNHHLAVENFNGRRRLMLELGWEEVRSVPEMVCAEPDWLHKRWEAERGG